MLFTRGLIAQTLIWRLSLYIRPLEYLYNIAYTNDTLIRWDRVAAEARITETSGIQPSAKLHQWFTGYAHVASTRLWAYIW